jgi:hypothetical protein
MKPGEGRATLKLLASLTKWGSIPALLIASLFSQYAGKYESAAEILCCAAAAALAVWAIRNGDYLWAGGMGMVAIVFSPLSLVNKVFTLLAYMAAGTLVSVWAALRAGRGDARLEDDATFDDTLVFEPAVQTIKREEEACHLESI